MDAVIKAAAIGILGASAALLIRKSNPELALLIGLASAIFALSVAGGLLTAVMEFLDLTSSFSDVAPEVLEPVLKCLAIGLIGGQASGLCKDAGQSALAQAVDIVCGLAALCTALPLMKLLFNMLEGLL
ncbi:MAG: SpoIIIAC/SpoIIIAD family protein [Oscillospiraceae bacterium]|jgi:stage III sporulation protein AD